MRETHALLGELILQDCHLLLLEIKQALKLAHLPRVTNQTS